MYTQSPAAISAYMALLADYTALRYALQTDRLIFAGKTVSFVVRNDSSTPHRRVLKLRK